MSPDGGTGRRARLRGVWRNPWRFKSSSGHRFKQPTSLGRLAQLVRALGLHPIGRGFESLSGHNKSVLQSLSTIGMSSKSAIGFALKKIRRMFPYFFVLGLFLSYFLFLILRSSSYIPRMVLESDKMSALAASLPNGYTKKMICETSYARDQMNNDGDRRLMWYFRAGLDCQ